MGLSHAPNAVPVGVPPPPKAHCVSALLIKRCPVLHAHGSLLDMAELGPPKQHCITGSWELVDRVAALLKDVGQYVLFYFKQNLPPRKNAHPFSLVPALTATGGPQSLAEGTLITQAPHRTQPAGTEPHSGSAAQSHTLGHSGTEPHSGSALQPQQLTAASFVLPMEWQLGLLRQCQRRPLPALEQRQLRVLRKHKVGFGASVSECWL